MEKKSEKYIVKKDWSEVCGKGCSTPGVTCIQRKMTTEECAAVCDREPKCKGF